jgi:succinate dehydrogenase / fumarate reductase, membrane anchor subunit
MSLRSPLGRVLGTGAAGGGAQHWWSQRVSAVALVPLTLWFVLSLLGLPQLDYGSVHGWIATGWVPVLLCLLLITLSLHSWLGVQVVVEDYVHSKGSKLFALLGSTFVHVIVAVAGVFAVVKIAVAGP